MHLIAVCQDEYADTIAMQTAGMLTSTDNQNISELYGLYDLELAH